MNPEIADKLYFSIGEASRIAEVEPHVLRYWESEFSGLRPYKGRIGRRKYRKKDIEIILHIKSLLYDQKYSIAGAKKKLKGAGERELIAKERDLRSTLKGVKKDLQSVLRILSK